MNKRADTWWGICVSGSLTMLVCKFLVTIGADVSGTWDLFGRYLPTISAVPISIFQRLTFLIVSNIHTHHKHYYFIMSQQKGLQHDVPDEHRVHHTGDWLPADHRIHHEWLKGKVEESNANPKELIPVLKDFKKFIESNSRIRMCTLWASLTPTSDATSTTSRLTYNRLYRHVRGGSCQEAIR